ncbi:MAG: ABC transporter substrate-binding protein [Phycisphaerae bacterium]|nr:ABC transporter substrate-binding protein [Phycisphaerae bacterium]
MLVGFVARCRRGWGRSLFVGLIVALCLGCSPDASAPPPAGPTRLVSFSPAVTQMLVDLGQGERIVGRQVLDPAAPAKAVAVGTQWQIDYERLVSLRPTDIFLQFSADQVQTRLQRLRELGRRYHWRIHHHPIETVQDVLQALYHEQDGQASGVGAEVGEPERARVLAEDLRTRLRKLRELTATSEPPAVLLVVRYNRQVTAAAPGTFIDELLRAAGGHNVLPEGRALYPVLDAERLLALKPQVVVVLAQDAGADAPLRLPEGMRARVVRLVDPASLLPTTTMPRVAGKLAALLHPEKADAIRRVISGSRADD